jgi:3-oxoacyl-[acyl-carrier protein] reductase
MALAKEGVRVVVNGTDAETLERSAAEIRKAAGAEVTPVIADVTSEAGRTALLAACPEPDILVNNAGGPPLGDFRDFTRDDWIRALDANMLAAIALIRATLDGMIARRFGRIVNVTSVAVKAPIATLGLSNGARSGLTGFVTGLARDVSRHNVTINNLLPGSFDTDRLRSNAREVAERKGVGFEDLYQTWMREEASGRFGTAKEFGAACAFLCAAGSGYITRQNLLLDGGTFPGVL